MAELVAASTEAATQLRAVLQADDEHVGLRAALEYQGMPVGKVEIHTTQVCRPIQGTSFASSL